jgi:hypothetical protein
MKKMIKLSFLFMITSLFICGCAMLTEYRVKTTNPASVDFYFEGNGKSALTFWRKMEADGKKGKIFYVGGNSKGALMMNAGFRDPYLESVLLDEGIYYLDSYQIADGKGFIVSEFGHYLMRNGLDKKTKEPRYLSFEVKAGERLELPRVKIEVKEQSEGKYLTRFEYKDDKNIFKAGKNAKEF